MMMMMMRMLYNSSLLYSEIRRLLMIIIPVGGSFLIPYLVMLLLVGLPAFFVELTAGQYARYLHSFKLWNFYTETLLKLTTIPMKNDLSSAFFGHLNIKSWWWSSTDDSFVTGLGPTRCGAEWFQPSRGLDMECFWYVTRWWSRNQMSRCCFEMLVIYKKTIATYSKVKLMSVIRFVTK